MKLKFNKTDRRILNISMVMLLMMLYLLYDDSLIMPTENKSSLGIAKIFSAKNDVRRKNSQSYVWRPAHQLDSLHLGDSVFAGSGSDVVLEFQDGQKLTLQENSLIVITQGKDKQLQLDLRFGRFKGTLAKGINLTVQGIPVELKENETPMEISSDSIKTGKLSWIHFPPSPLFHTNHSLPISFSWSSTGSDEKYRLQFSSSPQFDQIEYQETTRKKKLRTLKYPNQGKYFVRIEAETTGQSGLTYSDILPIEIFDLSSPVIESPKDQEILTFKSNDSGGFDVSPRASIEWKSSKKDSPFEIQLSNKADFSSLLWSTTTTEMKTLVTDLRPGSYFVRVRETTKIPGHDPLWSELVSFQVEYRFPNQTAPSLLTKNISYLAPSKEDLLLKWEPVADAYQYLLEISETADFQEKETYITQDTSFLYKNRNPGDFYFRVFASSKTGFLGQSSETGTLDIRVKRPILNPIEPKVILGKSPEDPGDPQEFELSWSDLEVADSYRVEVSKDVNFENKVQISSTTPTTKVTVQEPGQYFVRVQGLASNGKAITRTSEPETINYKLRVPLATPQLIEPLNQITLYFQKETTPYVWLEWKAVRQALQYEVEMATDPQFENKSFSITTPSPRFLIRDNLQPGIVYWRVRAVGESNQISNWSPPRLMTIFTGKAPRYRLPAGRRR